MKRIIWHWTAGAHRATHHDLQAYHFVIEGDGTIRQGAHPVQANAGELVPGRYAAHTRNCNTGSIGISLAAMGGANERPFAAGNWPIRREQVDALVQLSADLGARYGIFATRETMLSHAEVERTLGIAQRGKWDISWLPGMDKPGDAIEVGDRLRAAVALKMKPAKTGFLGRLRRAFQRDNR